jgi:hypothetical protein
MTKYNKKYSKKNKKTLIENIEDYTQIINLHTNKIENKYFRTNNNIILLVPITKQNNNSNIWMKIIYNKYNNTIISKKDFILESKGIKYKIYKPGSLIQDIELSSKYLDDKNGINTIYFNTTLNKLILNRVQYIFQKILNINILNLCINKCIHYFFNTDIISIYNNIINNNKELLLLNLFINFINNIYCKILNNYGSIHNILLEENVNQCNIYYNLISEYINNNYNNNLQNYIITNFLQDNNNNLNEEIVLIFNNIFLNDNNEQKNFGKSLILLLYGLFIFEENKINLCDYMNELSQTSNKTIICVLIT